MARGEGKLVKDEADLASGQERTRGGEEQAA
jgi:hypothetical protein